MIEGDRERVKERGWDKFGLFHRLHIEICPRILPNITDVNVGRIRLSKRQQTRNFLCFWRMNFFCVVIFYSCEAQTQVII